MMTLPNHKNASDGKITLPRTIPDAEPEDDNPQEVSDHFFQSKILPALANIENAIADRPNYSIDDEEIAKRKRRFNEICPPDYRDSDQSLFPQQFRDAITNWKYGKIGLGFIGESGSRKTRAMFQLLRRLIIDEGRFCKAVNSASFAKIAADQFASNSAIREQAESTMTSFRKTQVLLLDDLGKGRFTDRAEMELYDLLEHRTSFRLPTLWTSNANAQELHALMSPERADPIMRRLTEYSKIITFP